MWHFDRCANPYARRRLALRLTVLAAALYVVMQPAAARAQTPVFTDTTFLPVIPSRPPEPSIYLPVISGAGSVAPAPGRTAQAVYGLFGTVEPATQSRRSEQLLAPTGSRYILVPASAALGREVATLAGASPSTARVWGTLYAAADSSMSDDPNAYIVVTAIVAAVASPIPAGPPTATSPPLAAVARFSAVNLYSGPGTAWVRKGQITAGMRCAITGRSANAAWIRIECSGASGWIEPRFVNVVGQVDDAPVVQATQPTPSPTPMATPVPTAQPYTFRGWRALYFTNAQLRGPPAFVDDVADISANWGTGSPRAGMPADYFSVAFERTVNFAPGFYFFSAEADDGLRFLLDGVTLLDQWSNAGAQVFRLGIPLSGVHDLRVEYNEISGAARLRFSWQVATQPLRWQAGYAGLPNRPGGTLGQQEPDGGAYQFDYNWGVGSPTGAPAANWTARWVGSYRFEDGNYIFQAQGRDGIRLTLDATLVLNKWTDGYGEVRNRFIGVGAGDHTVTVDYFDRMGNASLRAWWYRDTTPGLPQ